MRFPLAELARALGVALVTDAVISGYSIDSRTLALGDLFFALRGPHHDGHDHVAAAFAKGAASAVVDRYVPGAGEPQIVAENGLTRLGRWARAQFSGDVIGVTGSAGKTTTKEAIAALLATGLPTGKTVGNLNNEIGVPLSILRLPDEARAAVLEMGMNHAGEIARIAAVARPRIGVVTNVGYAHIENFASIEGIAAAKRELIEALPPDGIAVLNADDPRVLAFAQHHPGRSVTFGLGPVAQVRAVDIAYTPAGSEFTVDGVRFASPLAGPHNIRNVLAGIAVAGLHGLGPASLTAAVRDLSPLKMRGEQFTWHGVLVYNDCYNSNPEAVRSMIDVLKDQPAQRRIAVLGEMLELGHWAEPLHREVGNYVAQAGVNLLVGIRGAACHMVDAAKGAGQAVGAAFFFETPEAAGDFLRDQTRPGDAILFKGSRGVQVERALERWMA